jgi:hypothetical protein
VLIAMLDATATAATALNKATKGYHRSRAAKRLCAICRTEIANQPICREPRQNLIAEADLQVRPDRQFVTGNSMTFT